MLIDSKKPLTEAFIEKHSDKVDLYYISNFQNLSESFIEKHSDKLDWEQISGYQTLSEKFIEKHSDKVDWYEISRYQKLSKEFMEKFPDKFPKNYLSHTIYFNENERYNICSKCDSNMHLKIKHCDSIIMQKALL
jgi:ribosomal protein S17E